MQDQNRTIFIKGFMLFVASIYLIRLFYLQVIDSSYIEAAEDNAIQKVIEIPFRGLIYDRNNKLIVSNAPVYDLYVTPKKVKNIDTLRFCNLFQIPKEEFIEKLSAAKIYSYQRPSLFIRQLSVEDFAKVQDDLVDFQGFSFQTSAFRKYHSTGVANAIGYVAEISEKELDKQTEDYYKQGDYVGLSGIEKYYEAHLRGKKGVKYIMKNSKGAEKGAYKNGELDVPSVPGKTLYSSIDLELQNLTDSLMQNKVGSAIAIEPNTGEILALVSAPSYDPKLLSGRNFRKTYGKLVMDPMRPLLNRPMQARYRPGSSFKTIQSLVALQQGVISASFTASHAGSPIACTHNHPVSNSIMEALKQSCNPYYYFVFRRFMMDQNLSETNVFKRSAINLKLWDEMVAKFGIGQKLGVDLPSEIKGILPDVEFYNKIYKGENTWKFSNIYSLAIGEGEITVSPMKMANVACILANRGYYITPHIIKGIGEKGMIARDFSIRKNAGVDRKHFEVVANGMERMTEGKPIFPSDLGICGKTGTSQNQKGKDHAIFICFAPKENPKIAVAVFVENGGFGVTAAAPVASIMIEKYLKGKVERTELKNEIMSRNYMNNVISNPLPSKASPNNVISNPLPTKASPNNVISKPLDGKATPKNVVPKTSPTKIVQNKVISSPLSSKGLPNNGNPFHSKSVSIVTAKATLAKSESK